MAWSVPIWKNYGFPKDSLYLERFVLKHATAHIHKRYASCLGDNASPNISAKNKQIENKINTH